MIATRERVPVNRPIDDICSRLLPLALAAAVAWLATPASSSAAADSEPPRLVLQITVDALRADMPQRFARHYGEGGWRYLLEEGTRYINANYQHANTETIVGHASLATGAYPADHGMIANVWFDRETGALRYNIEDPEHTLLTAGGGVDASQEIDPTQRAARSEGRSPRAIRVSTFGDELASFSAGRAKVFGVSVKDRGAVSMAGHAGTAYWFSKATGTFVTSDYYADRYPEWVEVWNAAQHPQRYADTEWTLVGDVEEYLFGDADDRSWETDFPGWGRTFPHSYGPGDGKYLTTFLTLSPAGDELTLDFAKALLEHEGLGQDDVTDYLAISFSATDYINHLFGPSSLEAEENQRRLDRTFAELFRFIDEQVGLDRTLIVLSADHGSPEAPGYLNELGIQCDYFDPEAIDRDPAFEALKARFGIGEELIETYFHPYLYLDRDVIRERGLDQGEVERAVAAELMSFPGIDLAVSSRALLGGDLPDVWKIRAVLRNHDPDRSGDIYVVFAPHVFIRDFDGLSVAATHGSPWRYDTHVPVIFAGHGVGPARIARPVTPYDIAPTLSAYLGINSPSGSRGELLEEVLHRDGR
ncbi:MAG: alkaline phosphatase family protein [Planctomycetes bacterium]|nr:alkaline phosphatase family protein [Planctomycetota bacterium]